MTDSQTLDIAMTETDEAPAADVGPARGGLVDAAALGPVAWSQLAGRAVQSNAFLDPAYVGPLFAALENRRPRVLTAMEDDGRLCGLVPVARARRALGVPLPALVVPQPYLPLGLPLLAADTVERAAGRLLSSAHACGAQALVLRDMPLEGPVAEALFAMAQKCRLPVEIGNRHARAVLTTQGDPEACLREAVGGKKLKEYRRQTKRLEETLGAPVEVRVSDSAGAARAMLEDFLALEAAGWKGARGTGLAQSERHASFVRAAVPDMAARGQCEVIALVAHGRTLAAGIVFYQRETALFFKIAHDETLARFSPGVQLALALTRHLFARPQTRFADSTANADHPMIDHLWRERLAIGDLVLGTRNSGLARGTVRAIMARDALRRRAKLGVHALSAILTRKRDSRK